MKKSLFLPSVFLLSVSLFFALLKPAEAAPAPHQLPAATQRQIEALLRHPGLRSGHVGLSVVALGKAASPAQFPATAYDQGVQPLLFGRDGNRRFTPASNFKLFTAAWVMHQLGPQKTFVTRAVRTQVLAFRVGSWPNGTPYPSVVTLYGDGDPSLNINDLQGLAREVAAQSPNAIVVRASDTLFPRGNMGGEEGGGRYPDGWTLDDALWYYGAPIGALSLNRNQVDITVTGGVAAGDLATVTASPEPPFSIFAPIITVAANDPRAGTLRYTRGDATSPLSSTLTIEGFVGAGKTEVEGVAVPDPRGWAQSVFDAALRANKAQVVEPEGIYGLKDAAIAAQHVSAPLSQLMQRFLKNSDNLYGEMLLRRAAISLSETSKPAVSPVPAVVTSPVAPNSPAIPVPTEAQTPVSSATPAVPATASTPTAPTIEPKNPQIASSGLAARAHGAMLKWLKQSGVPTQGIRFSDGSGLSRYDLATPISIARLLGTVEKISGGKSIYDALPIAGVDGTLKNRMNGTAAQGNVRAKTGTFAIANCLSGYVTTRDGQRLAVSIMTNFIEDGELARRWQGRVFAALADADFRKK